MFNFSKNTAEAFFERSSPLFGSLKNANSYLAHKSNDKKIADETLTQHLDLVVDFAKRIIKANRLDTALDKLIEEIVKQNFQEEHFEKGFDWLKNLFCKTILYHDHGKINLNFQGLEKKMNNALYKSQVDSNSPIDSQHSKPGAYIFLVSQFDAIDKSDFSGSEKRFLHLCSMLFGYNILKHHASYLNESWEIKDKFKIEEVDFMMPYLDEYQVVVKSVFREDFCKVLKKFEENKSKIQTDFSLFALLRLNFSLLTASDYLATSDYMSGIEIKDFGLIDDNLRKKIIVNSRNSEAYNQKAFEKAELLKKGVIEDLPIEKSGDNLNKLRECMAAEAVNQVRENADQKLFYLEAPTGGGKTNVSMLVASELLALNPELNKVFYVFPFTTLITQTHTSILKTWGLTTDDVALMHSKAGFQTKSVGDEEKEDGLYGNQKLNQLNNLFAFYPICLMTHIRFFDILKSNDKETIYLMHRLANSVVILDELQSYNPKHWDKMMYIIDNYARLFNIRFVLMSATLPKIDKLKLKILTERPHFVELLPNAKQFFTNPNFAERVQFSFELVEKYKSKITLENIASELIVKSIDYANKNGSVHTIIEFIFKKSASKFKEVIENLTHPFQEVFVLSGTILDPRRKEIINFLKNKSNRDKNILLVTTQVVEAGVDIDMDLGFKNKSLIDSDEQLAGRVNRNVKKARSTVYLFEIDNASKLYKGDYRFAVMKDKISQTEYAEILENKNFQKLYDEVMIRIDKLNNNEYFENFNNYYLPDIQNLNFKEVNNKFKLIDSDNVSIFVPIELKTQIESEEHTKEKPKYETVFSEGELKFLIDTKCYCEEDSTVSGKKVWSLYRNLIANKNPDFTKGIIELKTIQGILSKFTFSIFYTEELKSLMMPFRNIDLDFEKYWYLRDHDKGIYDIETGLMINKFGDSEFSIL